MVLNEDLRLTFFNLRKQCRRSSDAVFCGSALFSNVPVQVLQLTLFTRHSDFDKNSAAINNRYLAFVQSAV